MNASSSLFRLEAAVAAALLAALTGGALALAGGSGGIALIPYALTLLAILAAFLCARAVRREVARGLAVLRRLEKGDMEARVIDIREGGETGALLHAINAFADRTDAFVREAKAALEAVTEQRYHRTVIERGMVGGFRQGATVINRAIAAMDRKIVTFKGVTDRFEETAKGVVSSVASASTELCATAGGMSDVAGSTSREALAVASAAEQASGNVQMVATAADELAASIGEIAGQVVRSAEVARHAVERARAADGDVSGLDESAARIGEVVTLIRTIAAQTNLLALNATIEAARAGEAGKGFAVVANEVKNLANQTAHATEEISLQVAAMQDATRHAVDAIRNIGHAITEVDETMVTISTALEQQRAATDEIARNVEQASEGTASVAKRIHHVTGGATETGSASREVLAAATELSHQSERLGSEMDGFLRSLRRVI
ncbi:methyl-accepting chemotaxis protein [Azospirillum sp. SYSU D00513]|uniref:methyl-accepting chemotaxis protein n=1 Tax=Azospirillum sp. SYSU D00513 TaxID=2812561 RepID=UPI001A962DAA|nr:methyl-accepting chemotaxis protein [Azospirillum sp. SYSU D00513]